MIRRRLNAAGALAIRKFRPLGKANQVCSPRRESHLDAGSDFNHHLPAQPHAQRIAADRARIRCSESSHASGKEAQRVMHLSLTSAGISLRAALAGEISSSAPDVRAASCTSEARKVRPGDVFVALLDADRDGHDDAPEAARRGAAAMVCERPLPVFDLPQIVVADSRVAYGRLCQALVGNPARELKVIGVTGTHGKSTVSRLLASIFRTAGGTIGTLDSFGYFDGDEDRPAADGPLTAPIIARSLAQMAAASATHAVVEVSSRELTQQVLAGVGLDGVCVTNIARGPLKWHGSLQNYRQAKRRIFEYLDPNGVAVLNADDPESVKVLSGLSNPALTYGMRLPAEISATIVEQHVNEQMFVLSAGDDSVGVRTAIVGRCHDGAGLWRRSAGGRPRPGGARFAAGTHGARDVRTAVRRAR
jgi:UDP-N-acetylmuramoyl-L-alanyl-D-glutamate--2,6-diaminopimelate ligase